MGSYLNLYLIFNIHFKERINIIAPINSVWMVYGLSVDFVFHFLLDIIEFKLYVFKKNFFLKSQLIINLELIFKGNLK